MTNLTPPKSAVFSILPGPSVPLGRLCIEDGTGAHVPLGDVDPRGHAFTFLPTALPIGTGAGQVAAGDDARFRSILVPDPQSVSADGFGHAAQLGPYTADQIYEWSIGPGDVPAPGYDAVRGVAHAPANTSVLTVTGVAGYVLNAAPIANSAPASVALFGVGVGDADGTSTWGVDIILSDSRGQAVSAGKGRFLVNEFDFNVTSPHTNVAGLNIGGTSPSQPASATGVTVGIGAGIFWNYGFGTVDGSCNYFALIGTQGPPGKNVNSQSLHFNTYDASGTECFTELQQQQDYMVLAASAGSGHGNFGLLHGSFNVPTNEGFKVNFNPVVAADSGANAYLGLAASFQVVNVGNGAALVNLTGPLKFSGAFVAGTQSATLQTATVIPPGAHNTPQAWIQVLDGAGTPRFIPVY